MPEDILQPVFAYLQSAVMPFLLNFAFAILLLALGWWVSGLAGKFVHRLTTRSERIVDPILAPVLSQVAQYGLFAIILVAVLLRFGVEMAAVLGVVGSAALAIGLALQGTLSNVASGVMLLFLRPIRIGEFVETAGYSGTVREVGLFATRITNVQNQLIIIPNAEVFSSAIINYSRLPKARVEAILGVDYGTDLDKAFRVIEETIRSDERALADDGLYIKVSGHGASSVDITVRFWTLTADVWMTRADFMRSVKEAFDANGIEIPFPHYVTMGKGQEAMTEAVGSESSGDGQTSA